MKKNTIHFSNICLTMMMVLVLVHPSAMAAESPADTKSPEQVEANKSSADVFSVTRDENLNRYASDADNVINDGYAVPTFKNLSKMYWALAMFDLEDNQAIDNYLWINECELYLKYFRSDFELEGLRAATRASINKNLASFPTKFEIMIPVGLDRYNTGTERFMLDPGSQFLGSKRLEIAVNSDLEPVCNNKSATIPKYPKNFILSLSRPFIVTELPVPPEVAQFYIEQSEKELPTRKYRYALSKFGRVAYLRLKVTMTQFKSYVSTDALTTMADVFGTIDGFEMYADRDKTLLLFNDEMANKQKENKKQNQAIQLPENNVQLIESQDDQSVQQRERANATKNRNISPETGSVEKRFDIPKSLLNPTEQPPAGQAAPKQ